MAEDIGCDIRELISNENKRKEIKLEKYITAVNRTANIKGYNAGAGKTGKGSKIKDPGVQFCRYPCYGGS